MIGTGGGGGKATGCALMPWCRGDTPRDTGFQPTRAIAGVKESLIATTAAQLAQAGKPLSRGGARGRAPVWDGEDDDTGGVVACELDRALEKGDELAAVIIRAAALVLVVHADQQADEVEAAIWASAVDAGREVVGPPACAGDDDRV